MNATLDKIGSDKINIILSHNSPHPKLKQKILRLFQKDPMLWYHYRWKGDVRQFKNMLYPEYANHLWDGTPEGLYAAWMSVVDGRWVGLESATGMGKSYFASVLLYWFLDVFPNALVACTSTKFSQLRRTLWAEVEKSYPKFQQLHPEASKTTQPLQIKLEYEIYDDNGKPIGNDTRIAFGSTEQVGKGETVAQGAAGLHAKNMLIIVDEASGVDPAIIRAYKNTCTGDNNVIVMLGNPKSQIDSLHQFCLNDGVSHIRLSAYDHPNIVCEETQIHGAVQQIRIDRALEDLGTVDHPEYLALIRGISPEETQNSIIKISQVKAATNIEEHFAPEEGEGFIGVDVANSLSGDKACVVAGVEREINYIKEFPCPDGNAIAWNLYYDTDSKEFGEMLNKYGDEIKRDYDLPTLEELKVDPEEETIGVDATGVGAGTVNKFNELGIITFSFFAGGRPIKELYEYNDEGDALWSFNNLRSQAIYLLVRDLKERNITLRVGEGHITEPQLLQLAIELAAMKRNPSNLVRHWQLESKEYTKRRLSKRSPNMADALAIANLMRLLKVEDISIGSKNFLGVHI